MMLIAWIFMLGIVVVVLKVVINAIKKYIGSWGGFQKVHHAFKENTESNRGEVIEMVKKDGVWEITSRGNN